MKIESEGLIDLVMGDGPLCPNGFGGVMSAEHATLRRVQNVAHAATAYDSDGEHVSPEAGRVTDAVHYGPETDGRMRLYRDVVSAASGTGLPVAVEALYFRCGLCGLVLPANRVRQ